MASENRTTVDQEEIEFFKTISSVWWDENGIAKTMHAMNQVRVPLVVEGLADLGSVDGNASQPLKNILILDAGCAGGITSEALAKLGATVVGIDPSEAMIDEAKKHAALDPSLSVSYCSETVEEHAVNNAEKYDAIVSSEVLEHVLNHGVFIEGCVKCLKPGGSVFFTTYNKNWVSWIFGKILPEYVFRYIHGSHDYEKFISPEETTRILADYNVKTKRVRGIYYNFLRNTWGWSWTSAVNYALHAVKNNH